MKDRVFRLFQSATESLRSLFANGAYIVVRTDELPENLKENRLYVLNQNTPWAVAFVCPCGCKDVIHLSLLESDSPRWEFTSLSWRKPTLYPSIWRTRGCNSHFFLRNGRIYWC